MRYTLRIAILAAFAACSAQGQGASEISVTGDIAAPLRLKAEDLAAMPHESAVIPDSDGTKATYDGVPLREILKKAGVPLGKDLRGKAMASYVVAKAHDGYEVVFSVGELAAEFGNESILVVDKRDGKPLFAYQGPFRLVCPNDKAGARSVRMLETLEFVRLQK
jgi:DMSO/TMAO reductase YedYZ molybdopterin-dependent catalytic subunit